MQDNDRKVLSTKISISIIVSENKHSSISVYQKKDTLAFDLYRLVSTCIDMYRLVSTWIKFDKMK